MSFRQNDKTADDHQLIENTILKCFISKKIERKQCVCTRKRKANGMKGAFLVSDKSEKAPEGIRQGKP